VADTNANGSIDYEEFFAVRDPLRARARSARCGVCERASCSCGFALGARLCGGVRWRQILKSMNPLANEVTLKRLVQLVPSCRAQHGPRARQPHSN
jgi:hypothetical protein